MDLGARSRNSNNGVFNKPLTIFFVFLLFTITITEASIHVYQNETFREVGNSFFLPGGSEGIAASISDARSYISFDNIEFRRSEASAKAHTHSEQNEGLVQIVIFEAADRNNIGGSAYGGQRAICCTPDLAKIEGCKQGQVIRIPSAADPQWPFVIEARFSGNQITARMENKEVSITRTGMYNLIFVACDPKLKGLTLNGKTLWKNPDGFLPGRMAPLKKFYIYVSIAYLLLSLVWFAQYVRFWKDVLQIQHCIVAVIGLGLLETFLWHMEYVHFNDTGIRPVSITTWVVTVGAVRKTLLRVLILCVSMGYGVVRPTLGGLTSKVLLLGATYLLSTELLNITEYVGTINDVSGRARVFLVLPNAFLDAFLILWIFTSLSKTLVQLQVKRSSVKLDIYRKFSNALAVTVIASVSWIAYEVYFKATDPFNERWQTAWIITAFWDVLAFVLLCVICYLWAPSQSSQRYAYSEEVGEDSGDEESQPLTSGKSEGDVGLVKQEKKNAENSDEESDEEEEEDKRE